MCYSRSLIEREGIIEQETKRETERQKRKAETKIWKEKRCFLLVACNVFSI